MAQDPLTLYKLIVLYMLDRVNFPLTKAQVFDYILGKEYTTFMPLQQAISELIDADMLIILTAVEKVAVNFKKPDEKWLSVMTVEEAEKYSAEGQFAPGSMLPKVQACVQFAKSKKGRVALITSLDKALQALNGETGTRIVM